MSIGCGSVHSLWGVTLTGIILAIPKDSLPKRASFCGNFIKSMAGLGTYGAEDRTFMLLDSVETIR
jgi:hypothetical protein